MSKSNFPIQFVDKENAPERERLLRYLSEEKKLDAREVNLFRDALNELWEKYVAAGLERQSTTLNTVPIPEGFHRYMISSPGTYINFIDKEGKPITVTTEDMGQGFVEIWVQDGVSEKVVQYLNIKDKVNDGINDIIGTDSLTLYIQSSAGDLLMADDLNTTLTPTVERYFKDYTNQVISWQWFRESGDTQEDRDSDELWSLDKQQKDLVLTTDDFTQNVHHHSIKFTCQAIVNNQQIEKSIVI